MAGAAVRLLVDRHRKVRRIVNFSARVELAGKTSQATRRCQSWWPDVAAAPESDAERR